MAGCAFLTTLNVDSILSIKFCSADRLTPAALLTDRRFFLSEEATGACCGGCSPAATAVASEVCSHWKYLYISMWSSSRSSLGRWAVGMIFFFLRPRELLGVVGVALVVIAAAVFVLEKEAAAMAVILPATWPWLLSPLQKGNPWTSPLSPQCTCGNANFTKKV